jgi:hypothetical protein
MYQAICSERLQFRLKAKSDVPTRVVRRYAHALADAIAAVPVTPALAVAWAIHGDQTGEGVRELVRFLRQRDALLVDGDSISA